MGSVAFMNQRGHDQTDYPTLTVGTELTADQRAAVAAAEHVVREAQERGASIFGKTADGQSTRLDGFDATYEQIVIVPIMAGG